MVHPQGTFNEAYARLLKIFLYSDLHGIRLVLCASELLWAVTLLWPGDTFGRATYYAMSQVMSEVAWGLVFAASAATQFSILLRGDYHTHFATYFAGWNSVLWTFVVWSIYLSVSPPPSAISGETALALAAGWVWMRSGLKTRGTRASDHGT